MTTTASTVTTEEAVTNEHGLEIILSSPGRIRILQYLSKNGEANLTEIARRTSQSYTATARHLDQLVETAVVQEKNYGRVRIFKLRVETKRVKSLRELILEWEQSSVETAENPQA